MPILGYDNLASTMIQTLTLISAVTIRMNFVASFHYNLLPHSGNPESELFSLQHHQHGATPLSIIEASLIQSRASLLIRRGWLLRADRPSAHAPRGGRITLRTNFDMGAGCRKQCFSTLARDGLVFGVCEDLARTATCDFEAVRNC